MYDYLVREIEELSDKLIKNLPIPWSTTKLMEIYTYVYRQCMDDYSPTKERGHELYHLYVKSIKDFAQSLLSNFSPQDIQECISTCEHFFFFSDNLKFAFRYLNKFFVLKFKIMSLEEKCHVIFLESMWPCIEQQCVICLRSYDGGEQDKNNFASLFQYMERYQLDMMKCLGSLREGYRFYLSCLSLPDTLEDLMLMYHNQLEHIQDLSEKLTLPILRKYLFSEMIDHFDDSSIIYLVEKHASFVIYHARYEVMIAMVLIHKETFLASIDKSIQSMKSESHQSVFLMIKRYHDHLKALDAHLKKDGYEELGNEIYDRFSMAVSALFTDLPSLWMAFSRIVESDPCGFLFIASILEKKEEFVLSYGRLFYYRIIGETCATPLLPLEEMRKHIPQPLLYKLESLANDYRSSILLTRTLNLHPPRLRSNLFVFSEKIFMRYPHTMRIENISCPLLRESCQQLLAFYKSQHPTRTFSFHFWESQVFMQARFPVSDTLYLFRMSVIQYLVLRLFGTKPVSFFHLREQCSSFLSGDEQLMAVLHSFCRRNPPLLWKTGDPQWQCPQEDEFCLNIGFESKTIDHAWSLPRFKFEKTNAVIEDTSFLIRARLVRLFKNAPQTMDDLLIQLRDVTRDRVVIQKQLDYLSEQEYIEPCKDGRYIYMP